MFGVLLKHIDDSLGHRQLSAMILFQHPEAIQDQVTLREFFQCGLNRDAVYHQTIHFLASGGK